jgi:uncharacterized protein YhaN
MKIENIKINQYGKLENKDIDLKKLNIIFGKNEAGKSTLLNFIESMFYGINKNKNGKKYSDSEQYLPWNENDFSGSIKYSLDNEKEFYVFRDFNKKNPKILDENENDISGEFTIDKKNGNQFFCDQTKIDRELLKSTLVTEQNSVELNKNTQELLLQKIANLAETGNEENSYKSAIAKLDRNMLTEVGTDKSSSRPINKSEEKIKNLTAEITETKSYEDEKFEIENKKNKLLSELKEEKENKAIYTQVKEVVDNDKKENIIIEEKDKTIVQNNKKIEELKGEKETIKNEFKEQTELKNSEAKKRAEKRTKITTAIALIIFGTADIVGFFLNKNILAIRIILICLIPLFLIYLALSQYKKDQKEKIYKDIASKSYVYNPETGTHVNELTEVEQKIKILTEENQKLVDQVKQLKDELIEKDRAIKEKLMSEYGNNVAELFTSEIDEIIKQNAERINEIDLEIHKLDIDKRAITPKLEKLADAEEELAIEERHYKELDDKRKIYTLTKEILEDSYEEMKQRITPKFAKSLSENIQKFSNNNYVGIIINDDGLKAKLPNGNLIEVDKLSLGTIEQIYLALRLSVMNELSSENMPIILDEAFAYFDDDRLKETLEYLQKIDNQVIILTCTNREKKIADSLDADYNYIEL